jgi:hypothetical protein
VLALMVAAGAGAVAMQPPAGAEVAQPGLAAEAVDLQATRPVSAGPARLVVAKPGSVAGAGPVRQRHAAQSLEAYLKQAPLTHWHI